MSISLSLKVLKEILYTLSLKQSLIVNSQTNPLFFVNVLAGGVGAASKIASSVGDGLAVLSLDEDFQRERRRSALAGNKRGIDGGKVSILSICFICYFRASSQY